MITTIITRPYTRVNLEDPAWQRALKRALVRASTLPPEIVGGLRGREGDPAAITVAVPSRSTPNHTWYVLVGPDDQVLCECERGIDGQPCWHAAAAWLWVYRYLDPIQLRLALRQYADPARIERERARIEAALAGVLA